MACETSWCAILSPIPCPALLKRLHSCCCLSCNRSIASPKVSSPQNSFQCSVVQSPISSFCFLRSSNSCLHLAHLPITSIFPCTFPLMACCRKQFLHDMRPIQLVFLLFIVCRIFLSVLTVCNTSSFLTLSVQPILSVLLQHHISKLSVYFWSTFHNDQFQHLTQLCTQFSTLLVSCLNLSSVCWWIEPSSCWMLLMHHTYPVTQKTYQVYMIAASVV